MKCPHCNKEGKSTVLESRPHDGCVWRRRMCPLCIKTFVSRETAEPGMTMPTMTQSRHRLKDRKIKPEQYNVRWGSK
jgi:transcriptional regulator NrdR family protein